MVTNPNFIKFQTDDSLFRDFTEGLSEEVRAFCSFYSHLKNSGFYQNGSPVVIYQHNEESGLEKALIKSGQPNVDMNPSEEEIRDIFESSYVPLRFVPSLAKKFQKAGLMDKKIAERIKEGFLQLRNNHAYHEYRMKKDQGNQYLSRSVSDLFEIADRLDGVDVCYDLGEKTPQVLFKGNKLNKARSVVNGESTFGGEAEFIFYATEYMRSYQAWAERNEDYGIVFAVFNPDNKYRMVRTDNRLSFFVGDEYVTEQKIDPRDLLLIPTREEAIKIQHATTRSEALELLGRSNEEQQLYEQSIMDRFS